MPGKGRNIIVIGTSAGGMEALDDLIGQLPTDLPASIFIVQHMAPESTGEALLHRLRKYKSFACQLAKNGQAFKPGRIYIAPLIPTYWSKSIRFWLPKALAKIAVGRE